MSSRTNSVTECGCSACTIGSPLHSHTWHYREHEEGWTRHCVCGASEVLDELDGYDPFAVGVEYEQVISRNREDAQAFYEKAMSTIDHPPHYNQGDIEVIDVIEDWGWKTGFCLGNAVKYIARAEHKGSFDSDIKKAIWYLERLLK